MSAPWKQKTKSAGGDGDYEVPPAGTHPAVLVGLFDVGTHTEDYQGTPTTKRRVFLVWEATCAGDDGEAAATHVVGGDYTLSLGRNANLRGIIEKWRNKPLADDEEFDISKLVGKPCLLSLMHKTSGSGKTYAKIAGVMTMPKGMVAPKPTRETILWSVEDGSPVPSAGWIPYVYGEPLADVVARCHERTGSKKPTTGAGAGTAANQDADELGF